MHSTALRIFLAAAIPLVLAGLAVELGARPLAAVAVGAVAAALAARSVARGLVEPLRNLEAAVRELRKAQPELHAHLPLDSEVGRLAESIDQNAQQLRRELDAAAADKEQLEAVLSAMAEGVLVLDANGRIALANDRLHELFDTWSEVSGRRPIEVIRHARVDALLREAAAREGPRVEELEHVGPARRTLLVHTSRVPAAGERTGTVAVFHDVSEIRALDKMRRDFIANASHELRTPLTSIQGFADTLSAQPGRPDELAGPLDAIVRNSKRLGELIDDLLELSRIEGRREPIRASDVDVARICKTLVDDSALRRRDRQIQIDFSADDAALASADASAVERVVSNLLDNAIKYTNPGGRIGVHVTSESDHICVAIQDSGMGIPARDLERIFERFYRVDEARSRALGGTGLGLSIVKHLVQAMRGEIRVESQPGEGSTFQVRLPRA